MTLETILRETFHWIENNLVLAFVLLMGIVYYLCSQTTLFSKSEQVNVDQNHKGSINLVLVYAPWCGHCKNFIPIFIQSGIKEKNTPFVACNSANQKSKSIFKKYHIRF